MPPFATPFGASVLSCGFPGCGTEFYSPDDLQKGVEAAANGIRTRRANHFAAVFGKWLLDFLNPNPAGF